MRYVCNLGLKQSNFMHKGKIALNIFRAATISQLDRKKVNQLIFSVIFQARIQM